MLFLNSLQHDFNLKGRKRSNISVSAVFFRKDSVYSKKRRGKPSSTPGAPGLEDEDSRALFEKLRELRRDIARQLAVPPYVVFHDKSLKEMASVKPSTARDFLQITGVGASKAARYSEAFLACIRGEAVDLSIPLGKSKLDGLVKSPTPALRCSP